MGSTRAWIVLIIMIAGLSACVGSPYQHRDSNEIKPGPGLLSGDDGVFTLYKNARNRDGETIKRDGENSW